jgi:hypothetical protein
MPGRALIPSCWLSTADRQPDAIRAVAPYGRSIRSVEVKGIYQMTNNQALCIRRGYAKKPTGYLVSAAKARAHELAIHPESEDLELEVDLILVALADRMPVIAFDQLCRSLEA